jgi:O-antigen ligase
LKRTAGIVFEGTGELMNPIAKPAASVIAGALACTIPLALVAYRLVYASQPVLAADILRPVVLAASLAMFLFLWTGTKSSRAERALVGILAIECGVLLAPSVLSTNPDRALMEWVKLLIMSAIAVALCRPLRHRPTARLLGVGLIIASAIIGALIVIMYLKYMGLVLPTYEAARTYKGMIFDKGYALNPIAFECVFSYILGMSLLRSSKLLWSLGFLLLLISSTLTGSRAPFAVFMLALLILWTCKAVKSRRVLVRLAGWAFAFAMLIGAVGAIVLPSSEQMTAFTEGRYELWGDALHKFEDRPLLGYGYLSAADDPAYIAGGYHSELFTALAEQGIIGSIAAFSLFVFLFRGCWTLAFQKGSGKSGEWLLFGCLFLMIRALIETPGLFGTAQAPADFLAYIFLAIVVAQMSRQEDHSLETKSSMASAHTRIPRLTTARLVAGIEGR